MTSPDILSPHYDDAVLSCWHLIEQPGALVVTVFGGTPDIAKQGWWDRLLGTGDVQTTVAIRQAENQAALNGSPATAVNLGFLDKQYALFERRNIDEIASRIAETTLGANLVASAGIGTYLRRHPDHITTRKAALKLLDYGQEVSFYADIPYSLPARDFDHWPDRLSLDKLKRVFDREVVVVSHELDSAQQHRKHMAVKAFTSQYQMVNRLALGALNHPEAYRWEALIKLA